MAVTQVGEPAAVSREEALGALRGAYRALTRCVRSLPEPVFMRPTRCAGWSVVDVLCHVHLDAQRILVACASPSDAYPDVDYVTYWRAYSAAARDETLTAAHARFVRIAAAAYPRPAGLVAQWQETTGATVRAAGAVPPDIRLVSKGHTHTIADLATIGAVEATVHHLDLTMDLPDAPPPDPLGLTMVRRTLDGMLGAGGIRPDWPDTVYALKATGRMGLAAPERETLGAVADRFPLFA